MRLLRHVHYASWVIRICLIPTIVWIRILVAFTHLTWLVDGAATTRALRLLGYTNLFDFLYCLDMNPCSIYSSDMAYRWGCCDTRATPLGLYKFAWSPLFIDENPCRIYTSNRLIDEAALTRALRLLGYTNLLDSHYCLDENPCKCGFLCDLFL